MFNFFFKNEGPFKISDILNILKLNHADINMEQNVEDIKDLFTSTKNDITFFHSLKYKDIAKKTQASFCLTTENLKKELNKDTTQICFPTDIGRQIVTDLNELDRLKENEKLTEKEITELETKIVKQDSIISKLQQKDINNELIVNGVEEKYELVEEDNKELRKDLKWAKIKTNIVEIVSGVLMATFVYIELFK